MRAEVILVRHAQSVIPGPDGPDDYARPLSSEGNAQAERLVTALAEVEPSLVTSSPYRRAIQTVEPFARAAGLPVHTKFELREWDSGLEPSPDYTRHYAASWTDPDLVRPGGESLSQLTGRATAIVESLAADHPAGTVVVGSHGTFVARALVGFGIGTVDWPFSRAMPMPAIYRIRFTGNGVRVTGPGL